MMPTDFAEKMTVNELNMIVDLLAASPADSTDSDSTEADSSETATATETSNEEVAQ